jgi:hypothetical protein
MWAYVSPTTETKAYCSPEMTVTLVCRGGETAQQYWYPTQKPTAAAKRCVSTWAEASIRSTRLRAPSKALSRSGATAIRLHCEPSRILLKYCMRKNLGVIPLKFFVRNVPKRTPGFLRVRYCGKTPDRVIWLNARCSPWHFVISPFRNTNASKSTPL